MVDLPSLIRRYYDNYNQRRIEESAELFTPDAIIEHAPFGAPPQRGGRAYVESAKRSFLAFPDAQIEVLNVVEHGDTIYEVDLMASGTHRGPLDLGTYGRFEATGRFIRIPHREVIEIRGGKITYVSVTLGVSELLAQLKAPHVSGDVP
jgi:predicted ester cyclase